MRQLFRILFVSFLVLSLNSLALANDSTAEIVNLKEEIAVLQQRLADFEAGKAADKPSGGLPGNLTFHGYLRSRIHSSRVESEPSTFEATEVAFHPRWDASNRIHGEAHIWFWPSAGGIGNTNNYIESAMVTFDGAGIGNNSKLVAGKTRNWCYGITPNFSGRLLSNYSLYSDSFHHDRVYGLQFLNRMDQGKVDFNAALINGYKVGIRTTGVALLNFDLKVAGDGLGGRASLSDTTLLLANRENGFDGSDNRAVSFRVGGKCSPVLNGGLNAYFSKISDTDAVTLAGYGFPARNRRQTMVGADFRFKEERLTWQGEFTMAKLAGNDYWGAQSVLGYSFAPDDTLYVQYGEVNYDVTPVADSRTWDKQQLSVSWKHKLAKMCWLQLEHEFNDEDPPDGTAGKDNNMTFLEVFVGF